ncbi:MAG: hypothetical protein ACPGFA_05430 [Pikeienuella sp.]
MFIRYLTAWLALSGVAMASDPMTAEEFRALTEGYTLHVEDESGDHFGSDQFPGDNRSIWLPSGGSECLNGVWAPVEDKICFLYESGDLSCWQVFRESPENGPETVRFHAVPVTDDAENEAPEANTALVLRLTKRDKRPVVCSEGAGV